MAIYKAKVETQFVTIPNESIQNHKLSYEATGLLAFLLSLPDDWEIRKEWLQKQKQRCGRDKLTKMMNELIDAGFVRKQVKQGESGKLEGVDWYVYPTVQLKNRSTVSPSDGKPATTKETDTQKKQIDKVNDSSPDESKGKKFEYPDWFEWLWSHKPEREGANPKRKAYSACKARLREAGAENKDKTIREFCEGLKRYGKHCVATSKIFTPHVQQLATFFGTGEGWREKWEVYETDQGQSKKSAVTLMREREGRAFDERMNNPTDHGFSLIDGRYWFNYAHYHHAKEGKEAEFLEAMPESMRAKIPALEEANSKTEVKA